MKRFLLGISAFVIAMTIAASPGEALAQSDMVEGLVTKIDKSAGKLTLKHGPIKRFDMEDGMTMVFRAEDPAILDAVKVGDKIKFEPNRVNGQFTVKRIEKSK